MRLAVAAIDYAKQVTGLQMGLGFATFYDPQSTSQTPVLSNFLSLLGFARAVFDQRTPDDSGDAWRKFSVLPVGGTTLAAGSWSTWPMPAG